MTAFSLLPNDDSNKLVIKSVPSSTICVKPPRGRTVIRLEIYISTHKVKNAVIAPYNMELVILSPLIVKR